MTNLEKYMQAFCDVFETENPEDAVSFSMGETPAWDSIGHMSLIAALEDAFDVEFEPEEMLSINSFETGKEVLSKKGIDF